MAQDVLAVLEHLRWARAHVVGISCRAGGCVELWRRGMGGMIAQELALLAPQRVASLALLATYSSALLAMPTFTALLDLARCSEHLVELLRARIHGAADQRLEGTRPGVDALELPTALVGGEAPLSRSRA